MIFRLLSNLDLYTLSRRKRGVIESNPSALVKTPGAFCFYLFTRTLDEPLGGSLSDRWGKVVRDPAGMFPGRSGHFATSSVTFQMEDGDLTLGVRKDDLGASASFGGVYYRADPRG
jgi:hypothetical protein